MSGSEIWQQNTGGYSSCAHWEFEQIITFFQLARRCKALFQSPDLEDCLNNDAQVHESHFRGSSSFHDHLGANMFCCAFAGLEFNRAVTFHLSELVSPPTPSLLGANNLSLQDILVLQILHGS